jgi:oxygen-independent coproporphyrinogen-3 oxidase
LAGIYFHIPFCRQACTYCNFHFSTSQHYRQELIQMMAKEAVEESDCLEGSTVATIYFGGGTPSLLPPEEIGLLLETVRKQYVLDPNTEITLEANPDDINETLLQAWKSMGINRLSIGVQSFFEEELQWMNRAHNSRQALEGLQLAVRYFDNITLDLIYGSPLLTDEMWRHNVETATELGINHLSCYALTVEEKTPLHKQISRNISQDVDSDRQARQFLLLMEWLREKGYEHYEVSNFARPGFKSRHNSAYWTGTSYLGLGPSAHSFNGRERRWNIANNQAYIRFMKEETRLREGEVLTDTQRLNEYLMISLRTKEGLRLDRVKEQFGDKERMAIEKELLRFEGQGFFLREGDRVWLSDEGMVRADGLASALFR